MAVSSSSPRPANPYRCPPGPYERASLIAWYLKTHKPKSKLVILDAKDAFSKQRLFEGGWKALYPGLVEWIGLSAGGKVTAVDAAAMTVTTDFETYKAAVANIIPPQKAGRIAELAGVADRTGWCPVDPISFESRLQPNIHVIGDAAIMGAMPKSAFAANAQAKVCAAALATLFSGQSPEEPRLINTCFSLVAPDYGISVAGVLSSGQRAIGGCRRRRRHEPARGTAVAARGGSALCRRLVPHDHARGFRVIAAVAFAGMAALGATFQPVATIGATEPLQPFEVVRRRHPKIADGRARRSTKRSCHRCRSPARTLHSLP